jgi:predicted enzyme related to lactoylglutathione lyase
MTMTLRIEIVPANLDATADFYTGVLGFALVRDQRDGSPGYLALERGQVRIGAAYRDEPEGQPGRRPPSGTEIVLEVDDLDAEHARVVAAGWPIEEDLTDRPWGLRDFRVLDPSGYYLRLTSQDRP